MLTTPPPPRLPPSRKGRVRPLSPSLRQQHTTVYKLYACMSFIGVSSRGGGVVYILRITLSLWDHVLSCFVL